MQQDSPQLSAKMPFIEKTFNYRVFEKYILNSNQNFEDLVQQIRSCKETHQSIRFSVWRLLTGVFSAHSTIEQKLEILDTKRNEYQQLVAKFIKNEDTSTKAPIKKDPLSRDAGTGISTNYYENQELRNTIKMDISRTYQEIQFFENTRIKALMLNILFIWSKKNNSISYIQGMNEVAASIVYVYFQECLSKEVEELYQDSEQMETILKFNNVDFAEADIYSMFHQVMNDGQHMEMFRPNYSEKQRVQLGSKKPSPILNRIAKLQDQYLKIVDIELFRHIKLLDVELRVLKIFDNRCIFTREFTLVESFIVWDAMFLEYQSNPQNNNLALIDCITLAMMSFVRNGVLEQDDTSQCYQKFLKYPQIASLKTLIDTAFIFKDMINDPERALQLQEQTQHIFLGKQALTIEKESPTKALIQPLQKISTSKPILLIPSTKSQPNSGPQNQTSNNSKQKEIPQREVPVLQNQNQQIQQVPSLIEVKDSPTKSNDNAQIVLQAEEVQIIIKALEEGLQKISETGNDEILRDTKSDMLEIKTMLEREMQQQDKQKKVNNKF